MRKAILFLFLLAGMGYSAIGDRFSVDGFRIDSDGDVIMTGQLQNTSGVVNVKQEFVAPVAKSTFSVREISISTASLVGSTTTTGGITQPAACRNIRIVAAFGTSTATSTITGSSVLTGYDARGESQTETISFSTTTGTGVKAWSKISSFVTTISTYTTATGVESTCKISIGTGDTLGLNNDITSYTDVYKIVETQADVTPTSSNISATYNTYTPADVPDGTSNYEVHYKAINR